MLATVLHISKCAKNKSSVVPWSTFMHTACSILHNGSTQSAQPLERRLHSQTLADKVEPQHAVVTLRPVQYVLSRSHTRRWRRRTRLVDERRPQTCEYDVSVPLGVSLCQRRRVHASCHGVSVLKRHRSTDIDLSIPFGGAVVTAIRTLCPCVARVRLPIRFWTHFLYEILFS